ncbi:hypothetical protein KY284_019368 [Solanum tuberosum]|nr:hypothetical protein KY284_019368 [Solanum tuberosum]
MENSSIVLLPRIFKLSKLKHVSINVRSFFGVGAADPRRILEAENSKLTLSRIFISCSECTDVALEKFPNLQHLNCIVNEPTDPPTHCNWFPKFDVLNKLESLVALYGPMYTYGFPNEYHFPSSLKELRLFNFLLTPALLSAITALPQLEILAIILSVFVEDKLYESEDIYQSLKTLSLQMVDLSVWEVDSGTFPKLEELILENCYELTEIPCAFGDIDTLKSIRVVHSICEIGDSAMEIKKDVAAYTGEDRLDVDISDAYE